MVYNVVHGLVERLAVDPTKGSKLASFLIQLKNEINSSNNSIARKCPATNQLTVDAGQEIVEYLKRLQIITLTKPILAACIQAQTPQDLNKATNAGINSIINLPDHVSKKLDSLRAILEESQAGVTTIKEVDAEELNKKFNLVVSPSGLEISVVLTLFFLAVTALAVTALAYVTLKAKVMLGTSEAYWGFLNAGIIITFCVNAVILNLIKLLRFKKIEIQLLRKPNENMLKMLS